MAQPVRVGLFFPRSGQRLFVIYPELAPNKTENPPYEQPVRLASPYHTTPNVLTSPDDTAHTS